MFGKMKGHEFTVVDFVGPKAAGPRGADIVVQKPAPPGHEWYKCPNCGGQHLRRVR